MKFILDTNTLLLLIVGMASKSYILDFKPTYEFSEADYDLLIELLNEAEVMVTIPKVIAETSNHLSKGFKSAAIRRHVWSVFQSFIMQTEEIQFRSLDGSQDAAFMRLGVTDAILATLGEATYVVVTCDVPLFLEIQGRNQRAINFNHEIGRQVFR